MRLLNKHLQNFTIAISLLLSSLFTIEISADTLVTYKDIHNLSEITTFTANTFFQQGLESIMTYQYYRRFYNPKDKEKLRKIAERATHDLSTALKNQKQLKEKIENYQGEDWDEIYGSTGLWQKLYTDIYVTSLTKYNIDIYLALTARQNKNQILQNILAQIDSLDENYHTTPYSRFLRAKILSQLSSTNPEYKQKSIYLIDEILAQKDVPETPYFKAALEKINLTGQTNQLENLTEELAQSRCKDIPELTIPLAILQLKHNHSTINKSFSRWPQIEEFLGSLLLTNLSYLISQQQSLPQINTSEAELAAEAAWKNKPQEYIPLLQNLCDKFQTSLITYVTAAASAESSPKKSVNLLVKASSLQQTQKSKKLNIEAEKIAGQAARLAYNLFISDSSNCRIALEAFDNYSAISGEKIDEELEYLYTIVLSDCGQTEKSKKLLEKIAGRAGGNYRNRARLDLIIQTIHQGQYEKQSQRDEILEQLKDLIEESKGQTKEKNKIRTEAITIYCQLLLEKQDKQSAQMVLNMLSKEKPAVNSTLAAIKSKALRITGRIEEAVHSLAESELESSDLSAREVMELLTEVVETIDRLQSVGYDFEKMMQDCRKLAEFSYAISKDRQSGLSLAEISVFAANKEEGKLFEVEELLNNLTKDGKADDVDLLRCRARSFTEQGKFNEAAGLWARICEFRKGEIFGLNQRSWKWWRAKFYELYCWSKMTGTEKEDVLHTIEILENSYTDIPKLWAEKLNVLRTTIKERTI